MPVAIGIAIYLTQYAPRAAVTSFGGIVDLLAAVPSIIFGLWGIFVLAPAAHAVRRRSSTTRWAGSRCSQTGNVSMAGGGTIFTAGVVLAVMILPIITAVTREVYRQTPRATSKPPRRSAPPSGRSCG